MRQNVRFITVLTTALILFHSCKIDNGENSSSEDAEAGYFEDYASYGGKWGFIDTSGRRVIAATYDLVSSFSEGLAPVNCADVNVTKAMCDDQHSSDGALIRTLFSTLPALPPPSEASAGR
jgi:hypothetical protein